MEKRFFFEKYGLSERDLEKYLGAALSAGGDYADLYFEYLTSTALSVDESMVKSASQGISAGCGVRVVTGERTGYAYTDDLAPEKILHAARTAALIASAPAKTPVVSLKENARHALYPVTDAASDAELSKKVELVFRADKAARAYDPRIKEVRAGYADEIRRILVIGSDGTFAEDVQPLSRMSVFVIARDGQLSAKGSSGGGGRNKFEIFLTEKTPEHFATEAARQAILQLSAVACPAGDMEVVLGPGWPGVLLHEAIGHGLEADFNRKKTSAFSGLLGKRVASDKCTVVDNGTLQRAPRLAQRGRRGQRHQQHHADRERHPEGLHGRQAFGAPDGPAQHRQRTARELRTHSHAAHDQHLHAGGRRRLPEDIIKSVKRGLYAVNFSGGQVDITNGKFVFAASEAYLIEDGKITAPVKDATLIGNGPDVLTRVSMVGNDLKLDEGIGTCGKDGQSVPVGVGIPTLKIDRMTVGGTGN